MTWRVKSVMPGPVVLGDIGLTFRLNDIIDLDLIGRENAEKSNDIKLALQNGWIKEIEKGPAPPGSSSAPPIDPAVLEQLASAAQKADAAAQAMHAQGDLMSKLEENNAKLEQQLQLQQEQNEKLDQKTDGIVDEVKRYLEKDPLGLRVLREALENIKVERGQIKEETAELHTSGDSEAEIAARERILKIKDGRLEKNADEIGKSISESADDIEDVLGELDALGI